jgi:uncharacterized membrane protein YagU involved in acid resistance
MKPQVGRAIAGGFVGTVVMTLMMMFVAPMMGVHMDIAENLSRMMGTGHSIGMAAHFMLGTIVFPLIYVFLLFRWLPGSPLVKGLLWGTALWAMLEIVMMPMMGLGIFGSAGPGKTGAVAALLAHLMYGCLLGAIGGPAIKSPQAA